MIVKGRSLVQQAHERLLRENVDHGVYMNNHHHHDPRHKIQLCSIDTMRARGLTPPADLIVVDEAHLATSKSFRDFLTWYPDAFILGVTATPFVDEPLDHIAEVVVKPVTVQELVDQKFLVPLRYYAPRTPDLSAIKTTAGDFNQEQLSTKMSESLLVGDVVSEWRKNGQGRPTVAFAVDVRHAQTLCAAFQEQNIRAACVDARTPLEVRREKIEDLRCGKLSVLTNCGVLTVGVDMPHVSCLILARPTKSYNLHIQICGRGTRVSPNKTDCLILDHAGNVTRHGFITEERDAIIDGKPSEAKLDSAITCFSCYAVFMRAQMINDCCPMCGVPVNKEQIEKSRTLKRVDGELVEIIELTEEQKAIREMKLLKKERKRKGYAAGWVFYQMQARFGSEMTQKLMPKRVKPSWIK